MRKQAQLSILPMTLLPYYFKMPNAAQYRLLPISLGT